MEVLGQPHQTSLFVSHDAPQQGANIPLGIQYFARHLADQFVDTPLGDYKISLAGNGGSISIADIQGLFDSQGTKQLLSNYIDGGLNLNNTTFNTFQTELRNLGYPTQTRNIAISNGNHCGTPQEFNPSATLFSLSGNASTTALTTMLTIQIEPITGISAPILAFELNEPGLLLGLLPGSSNFAMNFSAKALPTAGTSSQVYNGRITYTKKIFSLFGWDPKVTVELTDKGKNNPPEVALSYDYYPGGKYQMPLDFETTTFNNDYINAGISAYLAPSFDFIPVPSALDIGGGSTPLNNSDYLRKYNSASPPVSPQGSPYANFTTSFQPNSNSNEEHISFNGPNGDWLATEIDNNTNNNEVFDCSFICSDFQIIESKTTCGGVYSVPNVATYYNWAITEGANLVTLTGNGTNSVTITPSTTASGGIVVLSINLGNSKCGYKTLTKTMWVGKPSLPNLLTYTNIPYDSTLLNAPYWNPVWQFKTTSTNDLAEEFIFKDLLGNIILSKYSNNGNVEISASEIGIGHGETLSFYVYTKNACGEINPFKKVLIKFTIYYPTECQYGIGQGCVLQRVSNQNTTTYYKVYPNPSSEIINIGLSDGKKASNINSIGTLYDFNGVQKKQVEIINNNATINVADLIEGIYILKINNDGIEETHQVIVN
jgi:hypothetical protein